jgi:hypothetical protein
MLLPYFTLTFPSVFAEWITSDQQFLYYIEIYVDDACI